MFDLLTRNEGPIEIIAVLDGYWPTPDELINDERVNYIHFTNPRGMRAAINAGVALAKGEYILKTDAHCSFSIGYDTDLKDYCDDTTVAVPRRYALNPESWSTIENPKYPVDVMYLDKNLQGVVWTEKNQDYKLKEKQIDDLMTSQGSCWFMKKSYYEYLELMDEDTYGKFYKEFQEIGFKAWLSGGRVIVNKRCWYAHWHKPKDVGRGYKIDKGEDEKANEAIMKWKNNRFWHKQIYDFDWMIKKFSPVPGWNL